jgi:probable phosphoglycerate mutase
MSDRVRRLYVLRHGEVAYFDKQGRAVDAHRAQLTKRGRRQIDSIAKQFTGCGVDLLVTSALPRALESAGILASRLGLAYVRDEAWNELQPGDLSTVPETDLRRVIVEAYRSAAAPGARFFDGELFTTFAARLDRGLINLLEDPGWTTAVIVTHDPVARYLLAKALGFGLNGLAFFEQDAGCLNIIDWVATPGDAPRPIIRLVNGTLDNPLKTGRRDPALVRFYEVYRASRGRAP